MNISCFKLTISLSRIIQGGKSSPFLNLTFLFLGLIFFFFIILTFIWALKRVISAKREIERKYEIKTRDDQSYMLTSIQHLVTQLREKEKELAELHQREKIRAEEAERLSSDIVRNLTSGLILCSPAGKIITLNPAAEKIFGITRLVALNQNYTQIFRENKKLTSLFKSCLKHKKTYDRKEIEFNLPGKKKIILGTSISPLKDKSGQFIGLLSLFRDITEEKRLKEIARSKEELALIGELSAGLAHEFRNSLGVILGHSRLLEKEIKGAPSIKKITKEVNFLSEMIDKFLSFAKPIVLKKEIINLEKVIEDALTEFKERISSSSLKIEKKGVFPKLEGDKGLMRTVFSNLIRNSLEADSTEIIIESLWQESKDELEIQFKDNGKGFPRKYQGKIFLPFFTTKKRGTGMGLAIVRKIILTHQGKIKVSSEKDKGTVFQIFLPVISRTI